MNNQYVKFGALFVTGLLIGSALTWLYLGPKSESAESRTDDTAVIDDDSDIKSGDSGLIGSGVNPDVSGDTDSGSGSAPVLTSNSAIAVSNQPAGMSVTVRKVELQETGWVVIHEGSDNQIGNALGAARLEAGVHENVVVELLRGTTANALYFAVIYQDNGDREFSLDTDFPALGAGGAPLMSAFRTN
ncbi:hypothetical protein COU17_00330 [Candidatus Kaiserbacteria bacterium CG10_big_fil_rev_8_21_14_0_10_49_17]|uniref:DUF7282 domain-containing protein n=1 Tax=Candidatus Kaiserbacteria bacterium CG10_big_fil_rev_8_21_14_0_10_49_17 TaxID=1974609 RepID=A0A2M6WFA3_9BACT|nr:MAG: hypothetical protein COU17_00330 [Candidatus Kaiserbacteria bacterium CG10_big_fil_rev_8_21_14_0_10_49_17]